MKVFSSVHIFTSLFEFYRNVQSLLHILFTAISVGNNEDVFDYVKKFHSNMGSMNGTLIAVKRI